MIYTLANRRPTIHADSFIAPSAELIGSVDIGRHASIWFNTTLRGDNDLIRVGARANVQDNSMLHVDPGAPLTIEADVTIGHGVMLHGCRIGAGSLVGIGSIILNHAELGASCLVGANTLITEGKTFPANSLILGSPGKVVRQLNAEEIHGLRQAAQLYVDKIAAYRQLAAESESKTTA